MLLAYTLYVFAETLTGMAGLPNLDSHGVNSSGDGRAGLSWRDPLCIDVHSAASKIRVYVDPFSLPQEH